MRLIDADIAAKLANGMCYDEIYDYLKYEPTTYDLDAVIAELEKGLQSAKIHKEKHSYSDEFINGFIKGYETAIDVVKRGGRK